MTSSLHFRVAVSSFFCLVAVLRAATYQVPGDFGQIQQAMDAATQGDTILVAPGHYLENLDFGGKDLVLTSHYQLGGDESIIHQTILDGGRNGAVVTFVNGETRAAMLNGFTVTNGSGRYNPVGGSNGGGLYIRFASPSVTNCRIVGNHSSGDGGGGGIYISHGDPYFAGLVIKNNSTQNLGGGMYVGNSHLLIDSLNRCSVHSNYAAGFCDIFQFSSEGASAFFPLDTITCQNDNGYFMGGNVQINSTNLNVKFTSVAHDLWVSPFGNDRNTGISDNEPLKTITHAFAIINADSLHHRTIHLMPGTYAPSGGQIFPINLRSYVSLIGSSRDSTILDLEYLYPRVLAGIDMKKDYSIRSLSIVHLARDIIQGSLIFMQSRNLVLDDLRFAENNAEFIVANNYIDYMDLIPGTSFTIQNCLFENNHCFAALSVYDHQTILVKNCRFDQTSPLEDVPPEDEGMASAVGMGAYPWQYPYPYWHRIENCVITRNTANYDWHYTYSPALNFFNYQEPVDVVNCTIADNSCPTSGGLWIAGEVRNVRIANSLFWNNEPYQIWVNGYVPAPEPPARVHVSHCLIQNGEDGVSALGNAEIHLLDGNITGDPLFAGTGDEPFRLTGESPVIDAGTAFWVMDGDTVVNLSQDDFAGNAPDIGAYEWIPTSIERRDTPPRPADFGITSISPNPFNPSTRIHFQMPTAGRVQLFLYTILGQRVECLADAWFSAGIHSLQYSAKGNASGMYIVEIRTRIGSDRKSMTLIK